ncbi:MAG: hypothetical protein BroJett038_22960 [Chloroflexota bacterium]|nr:MAG: hypothetical protein BroJett038_22960 [Chloroflexota bacterium]
MIDAPGMNDNIRESVRQAGQADEPVYPFLTALSRTADLFANLDYSVNGDRQTVVRGEPIYP